MGACQILGLILGMIFIAYLICHWFLDCLFDLSLIFITDEMQVIS